MQFIPSRTSSRLGACALLAVLSIGLHSTAFAQWKWRDGKGHVQYSDIPPPGSIAEQDILQRPAGAARRAPMQGTTPAEATPAAAAASGPKLVDPDLEAKRRKTEQDDAAKRKAEEEKLAAVRAENCTRAKGQLKTLEDGIRMARTNANGEREILDDKGRADETKRTRDIIASDCK